MANIRQTISALPQKPGVYIYHGPNDEVIYVGKAIRLRSRVQSYFRPNANLEASKRLMVAQIARLEYIIVRSETEALLLESTLIKKYRPRYNVILKDDKFFQYIKIALHEEFPSVSTVRRITLDGSRYFGPYTSGLAVRRTMRLLKRLFPYKSCANPPDRPCFDAHLGRCLGHATGPGSKEKYRTVIHRLIEFLEGHAGTVLKDLRTNMRAASKQRDFENAALYRDRLQALEHILEQQTVVSIRRESFDVLGLARQHDTAAVTLFQIRQGKLVQRDNFLLQHTKDQSESDVLCAFLEQYYSQSTNHPQDVFSVADIGQVHDVLHIAVHKAQRGVKRKLCLTAAENAADHLGQEKARWEKDEVRAKQGLEQLTKALNLPTVPQRIEMYDISNIQGTHAVGSMVVFERGLPQKSSYRKFTIKTVEGPDDVHMMAEVLRRRFQHKPNHLARQAPTGAWPLPDLIVLDGGKPQLNTVLGLVGEIPRDMPIAALAKQEEELFVPGKKSSIRLPAGSPGLFLMQRIRDEAHRFAIDFYRAKHSRESVRSILDDIPGLGNTTKRTLLQHFGTVDKIRQADYHELAEVVGQRMAEQIQGAL